MIKLNGKENPHTLTKADIIELARDPVLGQGLLAATVIDEDFHVELEDSGDDQFEYLYYEGELTDGSLSIRFEKTEEGLRASVDIERGDFSFGSM